MKFIKKYQQTIIWILSIIFGITFLISAYEFYQVGILGLSENYPFGSNEAISIGGEKYESQDKYTANVFYGATFSLLICVFLLLGTFFPKSRKEFLIASGITLLSFLFSDLLLMYIQYY